MKAKMRSATRFQAFAVVVSAAITVASLLAISDRPAPGRGPASVSSGPKLSRRGYVTPEEMRTLDTRKLGELIVRRMHDECETVRTGAGDLRGGLWKDAQIVMLASSGVIESIARNGFKNQHVTQTTGGCDCRNDRFRAEQAMSLLALPYSAAGRELLPKYALFNVHRDDFGTYEIPTWYGDVAFVFKDEVKARSTWTPIDSLGLGMSFRSYGPNNSDDMTWSMPPRSFGYVRDKVDAIHCLYGTYCEAQVWGELDLTDVEYLLVEEGAGVPESLKGLGLPVRRFKREKNPKAAAEIVEGEAVPGIVAGKVTPPSAMSRAEIEASINLSGSGVVRNILMQRLYPMLSETELLAAYVIATSSPRTKDLSEAERVVAELAVRPKTPELLLVLQKWATDAGALPFIRAQALYGLTEATFATLKPALLSALEASDEELKLTAISIAVDHLSDQDVSDKIARVAPPGTSAHGLLTRLRSPKLCELPAPALLPVPALSPVPALLPSPAPSPSPSP